jgi:sterol desaturase/sphingolipid hydroxylase (fatty acid hydroxylase superfamily)
MHLNYLAFALPLFLALMWLERRAALKRGRVLHRVDETIANLNVGIAERLCDLFAASLFYFAYAWLHRHYALFDIKPSVLTWVALFLATDFVWYWYHRFGHEVNLFWSVHVVHHQSEDFNYTVSARITVLQALARGTFWSVLPVVGFPPHMIAVLLLVHGAYPFFTHTQLVGNLGWIEAVLVTPSHHRVHHGSNPEYLDKNYGDVLIIWDKLFGTFAREKTPPAYGLTKPLGSYSFLWQHFHFMLEMAVAAARAKGLRKKIAVIFGRPDAIDPRIKTWLERKLLRGGSGMQRTRAQLQFIRWQTGITVAVLFFTLLLCHYLSVVQLALASSFILLGVVATGAMLEQRRWVFYLDFARLHLVGFFIYTFFPQPAVSIFIVVALGLLLAFYKTCSNQYHAILYA